MLIKKKGGQALIGLVESVAEKNKLTPEIVANLLAQALKTAFLKEYPDNVVDVVVDLEKSRIEIWRELMVVTDEFYKTDGFEDAETLIPISKVNTLPKTSKNPSRPKIGDLVYKEVDMNQFDGKITTNIQIFFKKLTENEVSRVTCQKWIQYQGTVLEGTVEEILENKDDRSLKKIIVSMIAPDGSTAKGVITKADLVWFDVHGNRVYENLSLGQTYLFYIKEVSEINVHFPIILSRTDAEIVKYLMTKHISEISEGLVEIKGIARIAGQKSKVLVSSNSKNIDPVGCCIGPKGKRLKVISSELMNEKIDVILWSEDPVQNVINSFVTGKIIGYRLEPEPNTITLIATLDNLLACIGKRGTNTKLVYMLTNWKINMKTIQEAKDENIDYVSVDDSKFVGSNKISERIFKMHFKKSEDILNDYYSEDKSEKDGSKGKK
ncbi:NusA N-terminal domain-containing protein [Candidatus Mycoplasma haematohominis]|uniref:Transcription termination/antitermination protein NusA n=1 Tax=Candidatus Mycoplasma haematohominis TaxID=1494318 RepID=A0A478FS97_9MOLU|nr:NusA N-terminal domain-containing protein [Candidatus Mycoplasma haemohominis]GCE63944.1 hypothetical protein MHSWG343_09510 [Candidatus Mycoplasma haemohominis]